ncbi:Alkaline phosphatase synthesis sensor protein PhoR [Geodia barretti]|uniref:Alkaline phosphatase synthesis sensor protein PhoR n=1 Tax=Geodia barretti TaxID=519541 RepID=A0AA35WJX7_GEOBA|nr:Alkaline phosphatase synthesis sensor protein PhoR [Geodia barretti]
MKTFLGMPIRHKGELLGSIYLTEKVDGQEFTLDDENTIDMFASQAAIAISNALKYRAEQRAKSDLQALLNSSPMGVFVLDAKTGDVCHSMRRRDEWSAAPIYSDEGDIVSVVVTVQDMTPLQEVERLRAEFLGMVNDELLTPLTTIKGSTATVLGSPCPLDPAETQQFFRIINEQTDQIRDLINNLLDATRIEAGTFSINSEPTDLAGIVVEARNAFLSGEAKNDVITDLPPDLPRVMADRQRIMKAMNTLFSNASKNSPEESTIRVTASQVDAHVAVTVTDEGRGVSTERLPHLFRKFSWADGDEGRCQIERAGLDLAVCKGIVEAHGGEISAESAGPELGTRVTFTIPVASEDEKVAAAISPQLPARVEQTDSEQERILAVDEDPQILRYVRDTLSGGGYFPITTGNLDEVIRQIYDYKPSLVLLDLVLAGSNEFEIVKSISQITDAPIIFLSGYATEYKLLFELSINSGRVLTHDQLLERVWVGKASGNSQVLRAFVKVLRRKLGDDVSNPRFIFTEHRVGYRMAKPNDHTAHGKQIDRLIARIVSTGEY